MKVGTMVLCQANKNYSDAEVMMNEAQLVIESDAMGFDLVTVVEHHFEDYSFVPDNGQFLSYIAAKTKNIKLMTAAYILPWNDPLRVVEKTVMLDIMSGGRAILGMGRGLAKKEYLGMRADMSESRDRFDEAAEMIIRGLETGFVEGDGKYYKQPRVEVRPRRVDSFKGRQYMVGMSPSSVEVAGRLGLGCLKFSQFPWEDAMPEIETYRAAYRKTVGSEAPPILCADSVSCFSDSKKAHAWADKYHFDYWKIVLDHYETRKEENFTSSSYANYAEVAREMNTRSEAEQIKIFCDANLIGTPKEILERLEYRRSLIGDFDITIQINVGHAPYEDIYPQMKLFADEVLPVIKSWKTDIKPKAAE